MKHHFIDRFAYERGFLQALSPIIKFITLIFFLFLLIILSPNLYFYFTISLILLILLFISKIPFFYFLKRIILITPFLAVIFFLSLLSHKNLSQFFLALIRSVLSLFGVILFLSTTKTEEFIKIFEKVPYGNLISLIFSFLYRYFYILEDELQKMKRSMISKGKKLDFKSYLILSGLLFLRSYERSERVLKAMISKGWNIERLK
ncbi:MAG: energy-coupling factor transporter transmembrane component T [Candidatus Hydrothermales bacterium]